MGITIEWLISGTNAEWKEDNYQDGGYVYDTQTRAALRSRHRLTVTYSFRGKSRMAIVKAAQFCRYVYKARLLKYEGDVVVRDLYSTVFAPFDPKRKNVVMLHHLDRRTFKNKLFGEYFVARVFRNILRADVVVVVSEHWRDVLREKGCRHVQVVYNSYDLSQFEFTETELRAFKDQLGVPEGKPIVYLGTARPEKGYLEAYEALKDMDAVFVVSGRKQVCHPPIRQYDLQYGDYLRLLHISDVAITMSKFDEGWCRNAAEAMLCGTPVVGSARGGMKELLTKGGQVVCDAFSDLPRCVGALLANSQERRRIGRRGQAFAAQFNQDYFQKAWLDLVDSLCAQNVVCR
jgi:glycosyltransferase involved in cell wall biosynthesis